MLTVVPTVFLNVEADFPVWLLRRPHPYFRALAIGPEKRHLGHHQTESGYDHETNHIPSARPGFVVLPEPGSARNPWC